MSRWHTKSLSHPGIPGVTMFLYQFVHRRCPQILVHTKKKKGPIAMKWKANISNSRPQMWPPGLTLAMTLTFNFQGQIWNLLYLSQKWSDCHETKSKHINWTQGLKCDHQVWPWPWPWPSIFKVKYGICYISAKSGPIATKRKANISIELQASNVTSGFDLDHDLDLWILKVKFDLDLWPHTWPWPWIFIPEH